MVKEFASQEAMTSGRRHCVVARIGTAGAGRSLLFFGHPDSEPLSRLAEWKHDPFKGEIGDRRLYGWGVADDLAGVAVYTHNWLRVSGKPSDPRRGLARAACDGFGC